VDYFLKFCFYNPSSGCIISIKTDVHPSIFHKYLVSYRIYIFFVNYVVTNILYKYEIMLDIVVLN
jgi:hypothetical protein